MKKLLILLLIPIIMTGCTAEEPGSVNVANEPNVKIVDSDGDIITIDELSGALTTVGFEHHELHEGHMFTVLDTEDLGNMAVHDMLVITPDTAAWAHLVWEIEHELEASIQFYMGTTFSDIGIAVPSFNRNGNSINTATTIVYHNSNISNVGTLVGMIQQGAGKKAGGSDRESNEFILKQDTVYLIRVNNLTVNNNLIFMKLNWYEHVSN